MTITLPNMSSWKTSLSGLISLVAGFVAFSPGLFVKWPWVTELAKYLMVGSGGIGLLVAKDAGVTGGTKLADNAVPDASLHAAKAAEPKP